jgi:radical SAM/Cys-rich protein
MEKENIISFDYALAKNHIELKRDNTTTLQINVGYLCNLTCKHCHLSAGPGRKENMDKETARAVIDYAKQGRFSLVDITGGAPEMNPHLQFLIEELSKVIPKIMLRSNLTAIRSKKSEYLMEFLKSYNVCIVASFPSINEAQLNAQRGDGTFAASIDTLKKLNALGYGKPGTGLEINLVSNPTGAFMPLDQEQTEKRFRQVLKDKWDIVFNNLYGFANAPLGRFRIWLKKSGNLDSYLEKLAYSFNPCAVEGLMCRNQVSVGWDGTLYDCDFNLACNLPLGGRKIHVSEVTDTPRPGTPIATADHCFTCTAGDGFT